MSDNNQNNVLIYGIMQMVIWITMIVLIFIRLCNYKLNENEWIWIINYIGMGIAVLNLFISKCLKLKDEKNKKYKPFVGFTVILTVIIVVSSIPVYILQSMLYSQSLNDIITLLALFFSLSNNIWDFILNKIVSLL